GAKATPAPRRARGGGGTGGGAVAFGPAIGDAAGAIEQPVVGCDAGARPYCTDPAVIVLEVYRVEGIRAESAETGAPRHVAFDAENNRASLIIVAELRAADKAIGRVAHERRREERFVVCKRVEATVGARPIVRGSLGGRQSLKDRFDRESGRGKRGQSNASNQQSLHRHTLCWPGPSAPTERRYPAELCVGPPTFASLTRPMLTA